MQLHVKPPFYGVSEPPKIYTVITKLNLASNPFRNRNLPHILALLLLAVSVAGALLCFARIRDNARLNDVAMSEIHRMDEETKRLNGEGEKIQQQLQAIQQQLQAGSGKLTPQAEADLTSQGQRKQRDFQRMSDDLQADVNAERNDILGKSTQKMAEVVKKLAEEKGYDVVVDVSNTVYFKPALEITAEALAAFNKAYPAAK